MCCPPESRGQQSSWLIPQAVDHAGMRAPSLCLHREEGAAHREHAQLQGVAGLRLEQLPAGRPAQRL